MGFHELLVATRESVIRLEAACLDDHQVGAIDLNELDNLIGVATNDRTTSYERRNAIVKLGEVDDQRSIDALVNLLEHDDRYLRRDVVQALGTHPSADAIMGLIQSLSDSADNIRRDAASLLGSKGDGRAIGPLTELLEGNGYAVRHAAQNALEQLEREGVVAIDAAPRKGDSSDSRDSTPPQGSLQEPLQDSGPSRSERDEPVVNPLGEESDSSEESGGETSQQAAASEPEPEAEEPDAEAEEPDAEAVGDEREELDSPGSPPTNIETATVIDVFQESPDVLLAELVKSTADAESIVEFAAPDDPESLAVLAVLVDPASNNDLATTTSSESETVPATPDGPDTTHMTAAVEALEETLGSDSPEEWILDAVKNRIGMPADFGWSHAKRMRLLFGEDTGRIESAYRMLRTSQFEVLKLEQEQQHAMLEHDLINADQADDLSDVQERISEQNRILKTLHSESKELRQAIRRSNAELLSPLYAATCWLWPAKKSHDELRAADLQTQLANVEVEISKANDLLAPLVADRGKIKGPIDAAADQDHSSRNRKAEAMQSVGEARQVINELILFALTDDRLPNHTAAVDELGQLASHPGTFRQCLQELRDLQAELAAGEPQRQATEALLNQQQEQVDTATNDLGASIADGFESIARKRDTKVRIDCSVNFRNSSDFKAGISGISGTATGKASVNTSYELEEIGWTRKNRVEQSLSALSDKVKGLGRAHAVETLQVAELEAKRRSIEACVTYIRIELERDFGENR